MYAQKFGHMEESKMKILDTNITFLVLDVFGNERLSQCMFRQLSQEPN